MFQLGAIDLARLEHHHGGGEWHEMVESSPDHDVAEHDPERSWASGRVFRCTTCEDEIRIIAPDAVPVEGAITPQ